VKLIAEFIDKSCPNDPYANTMGFSLRCFLLHGIEDMDNKDHKVTNLDVM